jgi:hypothetical protein
MLHPRPVPILYDVPMWLIPPDQLDSVLKRMVDLEIDSWVGDDTNDLTFAEMAALGSVTSES